MLYWRGWPRRTQGSRGREEGIVRLDQEQLATVIERLIERVGDTPFTATPYACLRRRRCDVYADNATAPRYGVLVPHEPGYEVYTFGADGLNSAEIEELARCLAALDTSYHMIVPAVLVPSIRARRCVDLEVEGLCFTFRQIPADFRVARPGQARRLLPAEAGELERLLPATSFMSQAYGGPAGLLAEGLAWGVWRSARLVSAAATLALTPGYGDVGVYTAPRHRHRGYATDCVEALFSHLFATGRRPLWRVGDRQKLAIRFAEKLAMEEIGTNGREVYIHLK